MGGFRAYATSQALSQTEATRMSCRTGLLRHRGAALAATRRKRARSCGGLLAVVDAGNVKELFKIPRGPSRNAVTALVLLAVRRPPSSFTVHSRNSVPKAHRARQRCTAHLPRAVRVMVKAKSALLCLQRSRLTTALAFCDPLPFGPTVLRHAIDTPFCRVRACNGHGHPAGRSAVDRSRVGQWTVSVCQLQPRGLRIASPSSAKGTEARTREGVRLGVAMPQGKRVGIDKRGNRTKAQKRRKAASLQKALAVVDRKTTKNETRLQARAGETRQKSSGRAAV